MFKEHFQTHGTPIMIGGGVLAYTLLGVSISEDNPEKSKFLILDPHYTGTDDIVTIVKKKGVSWKTKNEVFKSGNFYNFCMP